MSPNVAVAMESLSRLSPGERLELFDQLIDTVGPSEEWMAEVEARADDPTARFYSWEEVQAEANAILNGVPNVADPAP